MKAMWLCIISRRPFEDTCESALWRKVQRFNQCSERFHIVSHLTIWRSRRDVAHWLTYSLTHWTLAATWLMGLWWLKMKVVNWWKLFIDESCLLMKVINWWKLSFDENCLLMKLKIVLGIRYFSPIMALSPLIWESYSSSIGLSLWY